MTTTNTNEMQAMVVPVTEGNLKVMTKEYEEPVIDGTIRFKCG